MITASPTLDLYTVLLLIGLVQGLFLAYFFFIRRKDNPSNLFLGGIILVLTLSLAEIFLNYTGLMLSALHLNNFSEPLQFLIGPLFYFYIRTYVGKTVPAVQYLHLLPFVFYALYMSIEFSMPIEQKYNSYIDVYYPEEPLLFIPGYASHDPWDIKPFFTGIGIMLHLAFYFFLSLILLKDQMAEGLRTLIRKEKTKEQYRWILIFSGISICGIVLFPISKYGFRMVMGENIIGIYITFFIYLVGYSIIRRSAFFSPSFVRKYHTSSLSEEWMDRKIEQLNALMEQEKPFLKNDFSRARPLARQLSISGHQLSQMINERGDTNFFGMTNRYRCAEAKKILDDPNNNHLTIEQIAYDVGYNSKSAFYSAFKKQYHCTPHAYRKAKTSQ